MPGRILVAGLDARELRLEVRFLQRDPELVTEALSARGAASTRWPARRRPLVVLGPRLPDVPIEEAIRRIREGPAGQRASILALDPRLRPRGDGGRRARSRGQRGAAPPARALRARELGGEAARRAAARARAHPGARAGRGQPEERAGRALLRPQPQPERPRDAAREPGPDRGRGPRPRDRPPGARGPHPGAGPHRARGPGGGLALHRVRDRVPVPARGRAARDRSHGEARDAARAGARASGLPSAIHSTLRRDEWIYEITEPARTDSGFLVEVRRARPRGLAPRAGEPLLRRAGRTSARAALDTAREFVRRHG